jgi:hypothetical protein
MTKQLIGYLCSFQEMIAHKTRSHAHLSVCKWRSTSGPVVTTTKGRHCLHACTVTAWLQALNNLQEVLFLFPARASDHHQPNGASFLDTQGYNKGAITRKHRRPRLCINDSLYEQNRIPPEFSFACFAMLCNHTHEVSFDTFASAREGWRAFASATIPDGVSQTTSASPVDRICL